MSKLSLAAVGLLALLLCPSHAESWDDLDFSAVDEVCQSLPVLEQPEPPPCTSLHLLPCTVRSARVLLADLLTHTSLLARIFAWGFRPRSVRTLVVVLWITIPP